MQFSSGIAQERVDENAAKIGDLAYWAMLEEVYTSPKPGLVDLYSNGAHKDMDVSTFERSAAALKPYFTLMALEGIKNSKEPETVFANIRKLGLDAEKAMYGATAGVNTHKGLIFNMGILSAAVGACIGEDKMVTIECLMEMEQAMVRKTLLKEVSEMRDFTSNGEKNLQEYGTMGARGEAISGYRSVCSISLPVMSEGLKNGREWNRIKLETLFALMSQVDDSNIIARHDPGILKEVQVTAEAFLKAGGAYRDDAISILEQMDGDFINKNISAGGCADLLAVTIFLAGLVWKSKIPGLSQNNP
ncbi:triphosphoribosyl-dephospho-CoA synthase CitG [Lacrimispora sp. JR3]|uniref:triphosphoribosyl-dephospho-CoA synthase CitG n=1 Tax=Lacrimispora sinapis TaxID=3111456 RepID=UPI003749E3AB